MQQGTFSFVESVGRDQAAWAQVIDTLYQPLTTRIGDPDRYRARISRWNLEDMGFYRYESEAVLYRRTASHIAPDFEENFFVTIPHTTGAVLSQNGRTAECGPGQFMMHYSAGPSELRHGALRATVVRLPGRAMGDRIRAPVDRCAVSIPCRGGAGALFVALVDAVLGNAESLDGVAQASAGHALADLLAASLAANGGAIPELGASARAGHRASVLRYIATHYRDPTLGPSAVAAACGISVRYLHKLFADSDFTVGEWIMETRLTEARRLLCDASRPFRTVVAIAHQCGFEDPSHFSRRFRARFDAAPGEVRRKAGESPGR